MSVIVKKFLDRAGKREIDKQEGNISIAIMGSVCDVANKRYLFNYYDFDFGDLMVLQKDRGGIVYFFLEKYRQCSIASFKKVIELRSVFELQEYKDYLEVEKETFRLFDLNNVPEKVDELYDYIDHLYDLECRLLLTTLFCESMDHEVAETLLELIGYKDKKTFLEKVTTPTFLSFDIRQDELILNNKQDRWMLVDYYGAPSVETAITKLAALSQSVGVDRKKEIKKQKEKIINNKKTTDAFLKKLSWNSRRLFEYIQVCMELRDSRKEAIQKNIVLISDALIALGRKYGLTYDDLSVVHHSELRKLSDILFVNQIKARKRDGVILRSHSGGVEISAVNFEEIKEEMSKRIGVNSEEIRGVTACPGSVTGIAKIVLSEKDFSDFKQGDILITSMTRPEFVPLMKLAAAVVTDEGGITCHAAIISRELGVPCIIGTRTATLNIKSGSLVKVDADKGIIKIIK